MKNVSIDVFRAWFSTTKSLKNLEELKKKNAKWLWQKIQNDDEKVIMTIQNLTWR